MQQVYDVSIPNTPGNMMVFDESIDRYDAHHVSLNVIDPDALPRHRVDGNCVPLFPHEALRTNTIFEVARAAGKHTAWADKHPAYDLVNGPSGQGVEDLYTPGIECPSTDEAIEVAAKHPMARFGKIELRPFWLPE